MEYTTDKVIEELRSINSIELVENMLSFPEEERDGLTDMQILYEEIEYLLDLYDTPGTLKHELLRESKKIYKATKQGTVIPCSSDFVPLYTKNDVDDSIRIISEYDRLKTALPRIRKNL